MTTIDEAEGRSAFGLNVAGYESARPAYPEHVFRALVEQKVLYPGAASLEVGSGNGLATRKLAALGASPFTLVEPDNRFSTLLESISDHGGMPCRILYEPFEKASLPASSFDLIVIATAFHWLKPAIRVKKIAELLKPGGAVVLVWNVFQDMNRVDLFHEATRSILENLSNSPSGAPDSLPFALDKSARETEFLKDGLFRLDFYSESHWTYSLDAKAVRDLYEGFSGIARLVESERVSVLDQIEHVAKVEFSHLVERNMTTPLYVFRRV